MSLRVDIVSDTFVTTIAVELSVVHFIFPNLVKFNFHMLLSTFVNSFFESFPATFFYVLVIVDEISKSLCFW